MKFFARNLYILIQNLCILFKTYPLIPPPPTNKTLDYATVHIAWFYYANNRLTMYVHTELPRPKQ